MMPSPERLMDLGIVTPTSIAWELVDFGMNGVPRSAYTDAAVRAIKAMQTAEGHWSANESRRPPMGAGDFQAAAVCIYALKHYAPLGSESGLAGTIARAVEWLERSNPQTTQDRAFHALGLAWAGSGSERARQSARSLIAMQRPDGGWSQLSGMESDAYATGQALFALAIAGNMSAADPAYREGVDFLLKTQAADGTWHVRTRSIWLQPYFESGFPYGRDQFISVAGANWSIRALALALGAPTAPDRLPLAAVETADLEPWIETAMFGTSAEFWNVVAMPAPAPRRLGGRLFMIPAWFGEAKRPMPRPTSSRSAPNHT